MKQFDYVIKDKLGIHARPAGELVKAASQFKSSITISKGEKKADAKRIFKIMSLGVKCGDTITISAEGEDQVLAIESLKELALSTF